MLARVRHKDFFRHLSADTDVNPNPQGLKEARKDWPALTTLFNPDDKEDQSAKDVGALGFKIVITPDSHEELIGLMQTRGNLIAAAGLAVLEPLLGQDVLGDTTKFVRFDEADKFIKKYYGPSLRALTKDIETRYRKTGRAKDLTVEEVQRIKDLVSKVGSLEFRILANKKDDEEAITQAKVLIEDTRYKARLKEAQERGEPPPGPREGDINRPFKINLARGEVSEVTYSWVELGPQERRQLGLDNASQFDPGLLEEKKLGRRNQLWLQAKSARDRQVVIGGGFTDDQRKFKYIDGTDVLNGALFFSRVCENQNLAEEERKNKAVEYFVLTRDPEIDPDDFSKKRRVPKIDGKYLIQAAPDRQGVTPAVHFRFNAAGGDLFGALTRKNVPDGKGGDEHKRHLAIVLDGLIMSAPTINSEIRESGQISGSFTAREVDALVNILRAGALPASLKQQPVAESTIGSTLGEDTIVKGIWAVLWAFVAVVGFMILYYRFAGVVASIALLANLLLTIGFMVAVQATFTLPGLAGLVLMLGMAVDANVLIYERLREERERGATLVLALRNGYERALPTIIDTHLSSIFTAIVLYIVGNDQLKGFGVSLTVGLIISLFTSLFMTRVIFDVWQVKGWLKKLSMFKLLSRPDLDFMAIRNIMFAVTIGLAVFGMTVFIARGTDGLNIDFRGGTKYSGQLKPGKFRDIAQYRELVEDDNQKKYLQIESVQEVKEGLEYLITFQDDALQDRPKEKEYLVILSNPLAPSSKKDHEDKIRERVGKIHDPAVEVLFPDFDRPRVSAMGGDSGDSHFFAVRTTERETELVQVVIDRLFRDQGGPLMKKVYMGYEPVTKDGTRLRFYSEDLKKLDPELEREKDPAKIADWVLKDQKKPKEKRLSELNKDYGSPSIIKTLVTRALMKDDVLTQENPAEKGTRKLRFQVDVAGEGTSQEGRFATMKISFLPPLDTLKEKDRPLDYQEMIKRVQKALEAVRSEFVNRPQPEALENFDSQLAAETRFRALWAILASWGAIALYLWFRFGNWTFGLAAVLCLIHDLFFTLGAIAACHFVYDTWWGQALLLEDFKIDLAAVAALLTLVGYSVNDTIVVFDRIREVRGKNPDLTPQMINDSVNQTLSRTLLTSFTTWLVVFVLFVWGGPGVHLFAFVMVVGVVVGTYSSIYIASPLLLIFGEGAPEAVRGRQPAPQAETAPA